MSEPLISEELQESSLIRKLYAVIDEIQQQCPDHPFTLDGHTIGTLGAVHAASRYGLTLLPPSTPGHDAQRGGRLVQIKTTQKAAIAISSEPDFLLVFRLNRDGSFLEVYNGPGNPVWNLVKQRKRPKNGQYQVRLNALRKLNESVPLDQRIAPLTKTGSSMLGDRPFGFCAGEEPFVVPDDFDAPLPEEVIASFEGDDP